MIAPLADDLPEVLERIMTTSRQALAAETVSLLLVDEAPGPGQGELVFTVAQGPYSARLQTGFGTIDKITAA